MKTKLRRVSKRTLAVMLGLVLLMTCLAVGSIQTAHAWNSSTSKFHYHIKPSGGEWSEWTNASFNSSGVTTFTIDNNDTEIEFELTFNGTTYKLDSSQSGFTAALMKKTAGTERLAKSSGNQTYKVKGVYADTYTVTLTTSTIKNGEVRFKISGSGSSNTCSTNETYIVVGEKHLTNTESWQNTATGATSRNVMTYSSDVEMYKVVYTNIAATTGTGFKFRIVKEGTWESFRAFPQATLVDSAGIAAISNSNDNNSILMTLSQKANITITYTDANVVGSSDSTKSVTLTVTPAVSNVTAGTCTGGTVTVTGGTNVPYGESVGLTATPYANYHFKNWIDNSNLVYDNATSASTSAAVYGTAEVTALFEGDSFNITKASDNYTMTAPANAQYNTEVTISATPADGYILDSVWYSTDGGTNKTTAANGKFTMPASNVTVGAVVHAKSANTINYGVVNGQTGWGYVSVGEKYNSNTTIKRTIANGSSVYEDVSVNFGARPAEGYKFVGWFPNPDGSGEQIDDSQDYNKTGPSGNYYAKFAAAPATVTPDPYLDSDKVTLFIASTNKDVYIYTWGGGDVGTSWPGFNSTNNNDYVTIDGQQYMKVQTDKTSFKLQLNLGNNNNQSNDFSFSGSKGSGYYLTYNGHSTNVTKSNYTSQATTTPDPDAATKTYYPIVLNVENGEYGTTYTNTFAEKSKTFTVNHKPDAEHKVALEKTGYTGNAGSTSTTLTMPAAYAAANKVTVTYNEKQYYPVNFSAGPNGSIKAWINNASEEQGDEIKSGTKVKEGEKVYFKATPKNSSYAVNSWTGSITASSGTTKSLTVNGEETVKVYFKYTNDGESVLSSGPYFRWAHGNDVSNWAQIKVKDGRAFGYIDNPGNGGGDGDWWCFSVADDKSGTDHIWTYSDVTCVTDFDQYVQVSTYNTEPKLGMARVKSGKPVSRLIIDLGSWNGTSFSLDYNTFRVIPVYDTDNTNIDVYAKKGSYRGSDNYDYFPGIVSSSTLTIDSATSAATNVEHHANFATGCAKPGDTVNFSVTINDDHKAAFYVRGFSINGVTPELYNWRDDATYSVSYTIPANFDYDYLEITPIYYYRHTNSGDFVDDNFVQFYIENYDKALEATGWGNTLSVYPYYQDGDGKYVKSKQNAFGGYPGQPVIYYGGRRFIEIPTHYSTFTVDNPSLTTQVVCEIKGVTLSNDYWDIVHREYCHEVTEHKQTYDYDDFYKIFKETHDGHEVNDDTSLPNDDPRRRNNTADQITFAFKYRTAKNNFSDNSTKQNEGNYDASVPAPYDSFTNAEKTSKFTNGWEDLLDYMDRPIDIFGKQLTTEEQQREPLLIVSDDYKITYAGYYATTWTIYEKNAAGTGYDKVKEIAPSALIVTSKTRITNGTYPTVADQGVVQTPITDYADEYEFLEKYRGYPAQITFESAIENNSFYVKYFHDKSYVDPSDNQTKSKTSELAIRNDGRWYYSYYNDTIHANIRIEYKNDESDAAWTVDPFKGDGNQGTVTGGKAYFTNSNTSYEGKTETGDVTSNQNAFYEFAAEAAPGYVFAGWWFERDGIVTDVNADHSQLTGHSQMTSNATFVARYIKNPSGTLTVNHTLADGSVGAGTTSVKLEAKLKSAAEGDSWTTITDPSGDGFTELTGSIGSEYISYKSGYKFRVTLKTTVNDSFTLFDRFSAGDNGSEFFSTANQATAGNATTTSFEIDVDDLFAINAKGYPEQTKDILDYYSTLKTPTYTYEMKYEYPAYLYKKYGNQKYTVSGTFTYDELKTYMRINGENLDFKDDSNASKTAFINRMAPFEDNFMQEIRWNSSGATVSYSSPKLSVAVSSNTSSEKRIDLRFTFPYEHSNLEGKFANSNNIYIDNAENRDTVPLSGNDRPQYLEVFSFNESKTFDPTDARYNSELDPELLTAPETLYNSDSTKTYVFRYWSLKTIADGKHNSREYTRCYDTSFNFVLFQDTVVEPIYTEQEKVDDTDDVYNPSSQQNKDAEMGVTINFIENSRNQYNNGDCGGTQEQKNAMASGRRTQGDRCYTEFLMSFNNAAKVGDEVIQLNKLDPNTKKCGLIIESVGEIAKVDGRYVTKTESEYQTEFGSSLTEISTKLSGVGNDGNTTVTVNREDQLKSYISSNTTSGLQVIKSEFDVTELDNKNRIQYFYSIANKSHSNFSVLNNRNLVYRAYAYIGDYVSGSLTNIQISQIPVYFTIYDICSIETYPEAAQEGGYRS